MVHNLLLWRSFCSFSVNIFMPDIVKEESKLKDTSAKNKHPEIPVKTPYNDALKNTAYEPGLNQASTTNNELEPGTDNVDDE